MRLLHVFALLILGVVGLRAHCVLADVGPIDYWSFHGRLNWGLENPTERVIQTQRDFQAFWADIHTTPANDGREMPPTPELDFSKEMIIAIGMGQRSTGGYGIHVYWIFDEGDSLVVSYSVRSPGPGCMTTQSITSPVEILRLRKVDKPVKFSARNEVVPCSR